MPKKNRFVKQLQGVSQGLARVFVKEDKKAVAFNTNVLRNDGWYSGNAEKKGLPKPGKITFDHLRAIAGYDSLTRICVSVIKKEVSQSDWVIVPRPGKEANEENIDKAVQLFRRVNQNGENIRTLLDKVLEDLLVLDAGCIEKVFNAKGELVELYAVDGACYSDDTEVLTREGWKLFKDIDIETDEFATRNQITKEFEWQKATYQHRKEYKGEMYRFNSRTLDVLVSPNHRMLVTNSSGNNVWPEHIVPAYKAAKFKNKCLPSVSKWNGDVIVDKQFISNAPYNGVDYKWDGDDYCAFMGMYLSEGSIEQGGKQNKIYITQKDTSKGFNEFRELLVRLLGKEPYYNGSSWEFRCKPLWNFLKGFGKATDKFIPEDILNTNTEQLKLFWRFYMLGDGCYDSKRERIYTSSKYMADQLQEVAQKMGRSASVIEREFKGGFIEGREIKEENCSRGYVVSLRTSVSQAYKVEKVNYEGEIHCVSVPNEILYVRRNGQPVWCGNTIRPIYNKEGLMNPDKAYVQVINNKVKAEFAITELMYFMQNPQVDMKYFGYGKSPIESILLSVQASLNADVYNARIFSSDNIPPGMLDLGDMSTEEAQQFVAMWNGTVINDTQQLKFIWGNDSSKKYTPFINNNKDMQFVEYLDWLSRLKLATYGLTSQDANITQDVNKATSQVQQSITSSRGVKSIKRLVEEYFNREILIPLVLEDHEFKFERVADMAEKKTQAEIDEIYIDTGVLAPEMIAEREGFEGTVDSLDDLDYGTPNPNENPDKEKPDVLEDKSRNSNHFKPLYK